MDTSKLETSKQMCFSMSKCGHTLNKLEDKKLYSRAT